MRFPECLDALRETVGNSRSVSALPTSFTDSVPAVADGSVVLDELFRDPSGASPEGIRCENSEC
ncbi:hypothetical protein ACFY8K_10605 [Streptomyces misionensis]|uniref:hypothetical protein n=1 Tax=Streptomyces misionensis TaxID=67331 RepID=UPI0036CE0209